MALFVETTESPKGIEWHLGGKDLVNTVGDSAFVVSVQADGDELYLISDRIDGIRFNRKKRSNKWFGDDARFIVENL